MQNITENQEARITLLCPSKAIRVVLIGLGSVATETHNGGHLKQYLNEPDIDVIAGIDPSQDARNKALQKGIPSVYSTFEEVIEKEDFEFVSILTPTDKHLECCRMAVAANKKILCEKPLASTLEEAKKIEQIIKNAGIFFAVSMNLRGLPIVQQISKDISNGEFGKLFFLDFDECTSFEWSTYCSRRPEDYSIASKSFWGNPEDYGLQRLIILDKAVHFIDLMRLWTGANLSSVYAQGGCLGRNKDAGDNFSSINVTLSNGIRCRLLNIWGSHFNDRAGGELSTRIRIFGDRGTGVYESYKKGMSGRYSIYRNDIEIKTMEFLPLDRMDFAYSLKCLAQVAWKDENSYQNLESGVELMRVVEACYHSLTTNSVVDISTFC